MSLPATVPGAEIELRYTHSGGPGGQNVNKVATAVQLRWDLGRSTFLPPAALLRLRKMAHNKINADGILCIDSRQHRTQARNRADAVEKLDKLIAEALKEPKKRKPTRPSLAAKRARLNAKRQRSEIKSSRRKPVF